MQPVGYSHGGKSNIFQVIMMNYNGHDDDNDDNIDNDNDNGEALYITS